MRILLIEDDREAAAYLQKGLAGENHDLAVAFDGRDGLMQAAAEPWDLLIVDRMLPSMDGLDLVRVLRGSHVNTPVLFLTTLNGIDDRVAGLRAGGDDYLAKPFAFAELAARVESLGRRSRIATVPTNLSVADLEIDLISRNVRRAGELIELQPKEYQLLEYLTRHAGQVLSRPDKGMHMPIIGSLQ
jgi:two-component system OmpR family response regulator